MSRPPKHYRGGWSDDEDEDGGGARAVSRFDVVTGMAGPVPDDDDAVELCGFEDDDAPPEPCVLCRFSGVSQAENELQVKMARMESRLAMASSGIKHKVEEIYEIYRTTLLEHMPADMPEWTKGSIMRHLRGMHGTSSAAILKQVDTADMGMWMNVLKQFAAKRRKSDGKIVDVNIPVVKLLLKVSEAVQKMGDK